MSKLISLFLAAALAGLTVTAQARGSASCEWKTPAGDPFVGDVPGAVDSYTDIPVRTRERLKVRMKAFAYDDIVSIRRDAIEGNYRYEPALLDMHFGQRRICGKVTRNSWHPDHVERALAYCEDGQCIVVPLICRNVSRIIRRPAVQTGGAPAEPLAFEPPAAGPAMRPVVPPADNPTAHTLQAPPTASRMPPAADLPPGSTPLQPNPLPPAADVPAPDSPPLPPPPELPPVVTPPPEQQQPPPIPEPPPPQPNWPMPGIPPLPPAPPVPEPATVLLWAAGLAALAAWQRRRAATEAGPRRPRSPSP